MRCPRCGSARVRVLDSREALRGHEVRRRRLCRDCGSRFTTRERADLEVWHVVKRDGRLEPYDGAKFRHSLRLAMGKRPASDPLVEHAAANAERACRRKYPDAAPTEALGRAAVAALHAIDPVAALRYRSVFENFRDAGDFAPPSPTPAPPTPPAKPAHPPAHPPARPASRPPRRP